MSEMKDEGKKKRKDPVYCTGAALSENVIFGVSMC